MTNIKIKTAQMLHQATHCPAAAKHRVQQDVQTLEQNHTMPLAL
jgi:hypothetical protein